MKTIDVHHYDAFTTVPNEGNPAGLVFGGEALDETEMLAIAKAVGFNETSFPVPSTVADLRIRYFTPGHEMNLCGHATMATLFAMKERGMLPDKQSLTIETNAGLLPIELKETGAGLKLSMQHAAPQFKPFRGSLKDLADALGIDEEEIDLSMPTVYGSTGTWTLLVPIRSLEAMKQMKPNNHLFPDILSDMPRASVHPFCFETVHTDSDMHARHFSSPYSGTIEDPVTGTASGVMGAYCATYLQPNEFSLEFTVEQGQELGRDGQVHIAVERRDNQLTVVMTGTAVYVKTFQVEI
ncbi:PhzF family phenazine biosynthesis isomerase [Aureibacillus halotolerans]|uniref:PhzF family phenazine biosynthesis protein n=1 Tax=Aureibacillus halotolerans TaxID=1508390 RepID=A0A4V3D5S2_9BACI|nr:PhzF family phenazine biosynthesis isomerase [Aureibacillus halotolerans]TDQ41147.1 PhzF family phenazine biosynthesis protein [Aureibacillus halotolerans]